jgi:hypothetical protein
MTMLLRPARGWEGRAGQGRGPRPTLGKATNLGSKECIMPARRPLLLAGLDLTQLGGHRLRLVNTGEARGQEVSGGCSAHRAHNASWRASFSSTGERSSGGKTAGPFTRPKSLETSSCSLPDCQPVDRLSNRHQHRHETALTAGDASNHVSFRETRKYRSQDDSVSSRVLQSPPGVAWLPSGRGRHPRALSAISSSFCTISATLFFSWYGRPHAFPDTWTCCATGGYGRSRSSEA